MYEYVQVRFDFDIIGRKIEGKYKVTYFIVVGHI